MIIEQYGNTNGLKAHVFIDFVYISQTHMNTYKI